MKAIYGYGSPKFELGSLEASFGAHHGAGRIEYEPVSHEFETLSGELIEEFKGWRARVYLKLLNVKTNDYEPHLELIKIINESKRSGTAIKAYPRFSNGKSMMIELVFRGNFGYHELTNLNAGQEIELEMVSKGLAGELPGFVDVGGYLMIGESGYLMVNGGRIRC